MFGFKVKGLGLGGKSLSQGCCCLGIRVFRILRKRHGLHKFRVQGLAFRSGVLCVLQLSFCFWPIPLYLSGPEGSGFKVRP